MAAFQTRRARVHTTFCSWVAGATDDYKLDNRLSRAFKNRDVRDIDNSDRRRERRIDILKVDVEGWELNVLAGLEKTIMSSKKITIFCEYNSHCLIPATENCTRYRRP
jgi:FkbM family methyltransferase